MNPFDSPKSLLDRASAHLEEYKYKHDAYFDRNRGAARYEPVFNSNDYFYIIKVSEDYPLELGAIVFDAINCLRSAMDHAVFAGSTQIAQQNFNPKDVKFPFGTKQSDAQSQLTKGPGKSVPTELHNTIMQFAPYKGGDPHLYGFNQIRNENIHRMLSPVAHKNQGISIGGTGAIDNLQIINKWDPIRRELTISRVNTTGGIQIGYYVGLAFHPALAWPEYPVYQTLCEVKRTTEKIISAIEAETSAVLKSASSAK